MRPSHRGQRSICPPRSQSVGTSFIKDIGYKRLSTFTRPEFPMSWCETSVNNRGRQRTCNGIYGYRFPLSWSITGPLNSRQRKQATVNFLSVGAQPEDPIELFWKMKDYGVPKTGNKPPSVKGKASFEDPRRYHHVCEWALRSWPFVEGRWATVAKQLHLS